MPWFGAWDVGEVLDFKIVLRQGFFVSDDAEIEVARVGLYGDL